jgi:hypothetical protein
MAIIFAKRSALDRIKADALDWAASQGLSEVKKKDLAAEVDAGLECQVPDNSGALQVPPWRLQSGLVIVLAATDLMVDTTRGKIVARPFVQTVEETVEEMRRMAADPSYQRS